MTQDNKTTNTTTTIENKHQSLTGEFMDENECVIPSKIFQYIDDCAQKLFNLVESDYDTKTYGHFSMWDKVKMVTVIQVGECAGCREGLKEKYENILTKYVDQYLKPRLMNKTPSSRWLLTQLEIVWHRYCLVTYWLRRFYMKFTNRGKDSYSPATSSSSSVHDEQTKQKHLRLRGNLDQLSDHIFRTCLFPLIEEHAVPAFQEQLTKDRQGEQVERTSLKQCSNLFDVMGQYKRIEETVLDNTRDYVQMLYDQWYTQLTVSEYLKNTEELIRCEKERFETCMKSGSVTYALQILSQTLLVRSSEQLLSRESGLHFLLSNNRRNDVRRLCGLYMGKIFPHVYVPKGDVNIGTYVEQFIEITGQQYWEEREERVKQDSSNDTNMDVGFIQTLIALYREWDHNCRDLFYGNSKVQEAVSHAFFMIMNRNTSCKHSAIELLATYSDHVLKGSRKLTEQEQTDEINGVLQLFTFLRDKDIFMDIYQNLFSSRSLNNRVSNLDAEKHFVSQLKIQEGGPLTGKLEGMIREHEGMETQMSEFKRWCTDQLHNDSQDHAHSLGVEEKKVMQTVDLNVRVLTQGWWPSFPAVDIAKLPSVFSTCQQVFERYYYSVTQRRYLQWQFSEGNVVLKAWLGRRSQKPYNITVKTLQAVFLLTLDQAPMTQTDTETETETHHTNNKQTGQQQRGIKLKEIVDYIGLSAPAGKEEEVAKRVLHSLSCNKNYPIVKKDPSNTKITKDDVFWINTEFQSRRLRFQIPMALLNKLEDTDKIQHDRRLAIDAAIVRIMKTRQSIYHQDLIGEVAHQLKFFTPQTKDIRRRIENCINKEYMERDENDPQLYKYVLCMGDENDIFICFIVTFCDLCSYLA
jgi:cullin 1